jgi:hypothetical protein
MLHSHSNTLNGPLVALQIPTGEVNGQDCLVPMPLMVNEKTSQYNLPEEIYRH